MAHEQPDYSHYEFRWEPGRVFVHWELRERRNGRPTHGSPATRTVSFGRAMSLTKARIRAFAAMAEDAAPDLDASLPPPRAMDGNELLRQVQANDLAERHA